MVQIVSSEISVNELIISKKYQSEIVLFFFSSGIVALRPYNLSFFFVFEPVLKKEKKKDCCVDKKDN